ncbi:MAG TPA: GNAT family N-acetyltransferase [Actinophytocola sp.]|jgi:ASC-1-like (ASCH) protein/GNAT superfamily N-acetyltransferase|nr:GNAT family N-acetyltransferase [Actinophytocola sp.]
MRANAHLSDGFSVHATAMTRGSNDRFTNREVCVQPATSADMPYIHEAIHQGLSPYYDGNHAAHAERLVITHLSGGADQRGLLSTRQLLFVLWQGNARVGLLNLVFKRQDTCKISPLILYPPDHRNQGLGVILMEEAEKQARRAGARQIYCTVAERNEDALLFFRQFGFFTCGTSRSQYKDDETEVLLRRPLPATSTDDGPASVISVAEVHTERDWHPVRELLLGQVADEVDGADGRWLESLWASTSPPDMEKHDESTTWVFCAKDRAGQYRAAAVGRSKKGDSVKVMPVAATDADGFRALALDLPSLLSEKGRKAYLHLTPSASQVAILQESGWQLEALLPGAYRDSLVTQQWGCPLGKNALVTNIRIRKEYLELVRSGKKTLEIRVGYKHIRRIKAGDTLDLWCGSEPPLRCHVEDVRSYHTFPELLDHEDVDKALPGMNKSDALRLLRTLYPPAKEEQGVYVLELKASSG